MNERFVEDLKNRTDIVEVVKRYAPDLKKSGKNHMCRSPFRNERTPSFCVSQEKQFWYDFGNSEGGDVIHFIERTENLSFLEAVEFLADQSGLEVPKGFGSDAPKKEVKKDIFALHKKATEFFAKELQNTPKALEYLKNRGFDQYIITDWQLGYGGDNQKGLSHWLLQEGFKETLIAESGVAFERNFGNKSMMDRFWGRIMIPISEPRNSDIVAFSGRNILDRPKVGKYVNSPENPVYHKSATLFGLDKARKAIREADQVILVEGNFDVIRLHQKGFKTAVACCGTSLTEDHLRVLKRFTKNFVIAFDTDQAGKKATLRGIEMILQIGLNPFVFEIKSGKDIDDYLQNPDGVPDLTRFLKEPENALAFLLRKFYKLFENQGIEGRKKFLQYYFYYLNQSQHPIEQDFFIGEVAKRLKTSHEVVNQEFNRFKSDNPVKTNQKLKPKESSVETFTRTEIFLGFLACHWETLARTFHPDGESSPRLLALIGDDYQKYVKHLQKKTELSEEEQKTLHSWELKAGHNYKDNISPEIIETDLTNYWKELTADEEKNNRKTTKLKEINAQLRKNLSD